MSGGPNKKGLLKEAFFICLNLQSGFHPGLGVVCQGNHIDLCNCSVFKIQQARLSLFD
jgi:hypothetical protein